MTDETFERWQRDIWDAWSTGHYDTCEAPAIDSDSGPFICLTCEQEFPGPALIRVTGEDTSGARPTSSANALARAVRRAFPSAWWVTASGGVLAVTDKDGTREWVLRGEAASSLAAALDGQRARTFAFVLPAEPDRASARPRREAAAKRRAA